MRIALASLNQLWLDKDANFDRCIAIMSNAKSYGCELVIFPEMTLTGYSLSIADVAEKETDSLTMRRFGKAASDAGLAVIFGACLYVKETNNPRNTFCLARPNGDATIIYSKIHPFSFAGEAELIEAGNCLGIVQIGQLGIGAAICYDLRFPELYAAMANRCDAFITIGNWPERRITHWRILLAARAIENQCFVFGVNRIGNDGNGLHYQKSSIAVSPNGDVLEPIIKGEEVDVYDFDPEDAAAYRSSFPTLQDKQYGLYADLLGKVKK